MEELFSNNEFAIYLIASLAVITYTNFKENQRMFLLYVFTYATAFFEIFNVTTSLLLLLTITFIFIEYLSEDLRKLDIIVKFKYKILDYIYMMFFQYYAFYFLFSMFLIFII